MTDIKDKMATLTEDLRQSRDELRVQMHLAKAEGRDEWEELEKKWGEFQVKLGKVEGAAGDAGKDVGTALSELGKELKTGYKRIRDAI